MGDGAARMKPKCPLITVSVTFPFPPFFPLSGSLHLSHPSLSQRPQERGGKFQKPGDHSPLSTSGPQSDRRIRIRIAVHSPQCPSDESEGAREGKIERATGWGGGPAQILHSYWSSHSLCFSIATISCAFKFVLHIVAYTSHMCMHA